MKTALISGACLVVLATVGLVIRSNSAPSDVSTTDLATPAGAVGASVHALRQNDLHAFIEVSMGTEKLAELEAQWETQRGEMKASDEAQGFSETMTKLTASDAEKTLFAELQPKLQEMKPQMQMMAGMMMGMGQSALNENADLSADERAQASAALAAAGDLLMGDGITSEDNLRAVLKVVCTTARSLELQTAEQLAALSFTEILAKGNILLGGTKEALAVYGIDLDAFLDTIEIVPLSENGDEAVVEIGFEFLGTHETVEAKMLRKNGIWKMNREE